MWQNSFKFTDWAIDSYFYIATKIIFLFFEKISVFSLNLKS